MPNTVEESIEAQAKFYNLHGNSYCIGVIDCTHIPFKSLSGENAKLYRNRKGYFSINTLAICDVVCKFIELTARFVVIT